MPDSVVNPFLEGRIYTVLLTASKHNIKSCFTYNSPINFSDEAKGLICMKDPLLNPDHTHPNIHCL